MGNHQGVLLGIGFLRMALESFALFILTLPLLHLAHATTCQGGNCPNGLVITGGWGSPKHTSIETFPTAPTCTIPSFPEPGGRAGHTLSVLENGRQLVACGGIWGAKKSCISWRSGQDEWTHYAKLRQWRTDHAAVTINDKIILIGGHDGKTSGEIVKGGTLSLQNRGEGTCALTWEDGFLTIGGFGSQITVHHGKVDRYDSDGKYLGSLPDLPTPRARHACTSFFLNSEKALLVVGGHKRMGSGLSATTELFSNGKWTTGGNLPRGLGLLRAAHLNQQMVVTGGYDGSKDGIHRDEVLQYNPSNNTWSQIGTLTEGRANHAIAEVNFAAVGCIEPGTSTEAETLTTEAQDTTETEQEEVKRLIAEQFEEQRRFMAEQFEEQKRFIAEQFEKYFD